MPQSLSCVYLHLVFSTKHRQPFLRDPILRQEMHAYLGGTSKTLECPPLIVGGVEDHVHLLCRMSRTITQADWVKELKRVSSIWIKQRDPDSSEFAWQGGYGAFSVSRSALDQTSNYIANQEQHHQKQAFQDEYRALLRKHNIECRMGRTLRLGMTQRLEATQRLATTQHLGTSRTSHQFAPTGQCPSAQGCSRAATLGLRCRQSSHHPQRGYACIGVTPGERHNPVGIGGFERTFPQGSGRPATLGWPMESGWDSGLPPLDILALE